MTTAFTLCSLSYMARAVTLGESLLAHNPDYEFVIGLVDRIQGREDMLRGVRFEIVEVEALSIPSFADMLERFDIVELATAVKPFFMEHLFARDAAVDRLVFLDPDVLVLDALADVESRLATCNLVLTPHATSPIQDDLPISDKTFLRVGVYNLGFLAASRSGETSRMLGWWKERLVRYGYLDPRQGLFVDQIWANLMPLYFAGVEVSRHPGYNVAVWNLHERSVSKRDDRYWVNEVHPVVFFHFSGFRPERPDSFERAVPAGASNRSDLAALFGLYRERLFENGHEGFRAQPCLLLPRSLPGPLRRVSSRAFTVCLRVLGSALPARLSRLLARAAAHTAERLSQRVGTGR